MKVFKQNTLSFILRENKGVTLVEIMIVVTLMSLIGLGMSTLLTNMVSIQRKSDIKTTMQMIKQNLEGHINDDTAWSNTVNHATNATPLACLRIMAPACVNNAVQNNFNIYDRNNNLVFQGNSATGGLDLQGQPCNTFTAPPATGNPACPIRYNLRWTAECAGTATCQRPTVRIQGILIYNPENRSDVSNMIATSQYDIDFRKGEIVRHEPIEIRSIKTSGTAAGIGNCTPGAWVNRQLIREAPYTSAIVTDIGQNVVSALPSGVFRLRPGAYNCTITAMAHHQPNGFSIRLRESPALGGPIHPVGSGMTNNLGVSSVTGTVSFEITANTNFVVQHFCPAGSPGNARSLGLPIGPPYNNPGTVLTRISCVRVR